MKNIREERIIRHTKPQALCRQKRWSFIVGMLGLLISIASPVQAGIIDLVSIASDGTQSNTFSYYPSISANGRFVAFYSKASNLVEGDTNEVEDIFVRDHEKGTTERVSLTSNRAQSNNGSFSPSISADGRFVAFYSKASNLVEGDTNGMEDIFVYDCDKGIIERVSVANDGTQSNSNSYFPSISSDGRFIAFYSNASNLVEGDTNSLFDVFVYDRETGITERVSVARDGTQGNDSSLRPSISANGRYVAFYSKASNLVAGDTNAVEDVFVYDRGIETIERVSVARDGTQGNFESLRPSISANGRYVAFYSRASNLVEGDTNEIYDIFVYDRGKRTTEMVSIATNGTQGDYGSLSPSISANGRYVAFYSKASNLVGGDNNRMDDVFVHDRKKQTTEMVNTISSGMRSNSYYPSISADGRYVAFSSQKAKILLTSLPFMRGK